MYLVQNNLIKIISLNVNSIIRLERRIALENLINKEKPDIILLNETKLNSTHKVQFTGYSFVRNDSKINAGRGTGILIKENLKFQKIMNIKIDSCKTIETTIIKVNRKNNKNLLVISAYAPPPKSNDSFISDLNTIFENCGIVNNPDTYFVMAGDLNAKHTSWKNSNNETRGNNLKQWYENNMRELRLK
jgi:exonuclease III